MPKSEAYLCDCMELMAKYPDGYFDLAVVDPPYGAGGGSDTADGSRFGALFDRYKDRRHVGGEIRKKIISWDIAPPEEYFTELFRVSQHAIIWGGNYFNLPAARNFLVWDKKMPEDFSMAMAEYAWTNIPGNAKIFCKVPNDPTGCRFHPTQKPVELYAWIFSKYAKPGYKILDTHLGSGSSRIAAWDAGLDFVGSEIDPDYFAKMDARFQEHSAQLNLFL